MDLRIRLVAAGGSRPAAEADCPHNSFHHLSTATILMTEEKEVQKELSDQELDALDANLLEIETLYRSRCVNAPNGTNVVVREIEKSDE